MFASHRELAAASELRHHGHQHEPAPPIAGSSQGGGSLSAVDLRSLPSGTELVVETRHSCYHFVMLDDGWNVLVQGGRYFPRETTARIEGCTLGRSVLKLGWIGLGLFLEMSTCGKRIVTSRVRSISVNVNSACSPGWLGAPRAFFRGSEIGGGTVTTAILEREPSVPVVGRADLRQWADVIRAEYLELPGLALTESQAQRLWNLDRDTCQCLLDTMVREKFLKQTADAQYVRTDWCRACDGCG